MSRATSSSSLNPESWLLESSMYRSQILLFAGIAALLLSLDSASAQGGRRGGEPPAPAKGVKVGEFGAEVAHKYTTKDGLPSDNIQSIVVGNSGRVLAGTDRGLAVLDGDKWQQVSDYAGSLPAMVVDGAGLLAITDNGLFHAEQGQVDQLADLPQSGGNPAAAKCLAGGASR